MSDKEILEAIIDAGKTAAHPIPDFIFGGFIEHIGDLINHSLWSEVLDDRKFYRAVDSLPVPEMQGFMARMPKRNVWRPIGPDDSIVMDRTPPYVGAHCPLIRLAGENPRGIFQSGLCLDKKTYDGRIVITAETGVKLTATLIWGNGVQDRQSVELTAGTIAGANAESTDGSISLWKKVLFSFTCGAQTAEGRLEISGVGAGSFALGAVSLMPADNIRGFRADTLSLMKEMDFKILRMPGGNFISGYDWKNTIGESDLRPPILDPVWNTVQPNDVGVDELLGFCSLIGVEPYWCVSTGFGEPRSGAELVEYVNGSSSTEWGSKRASNGHREPYKVRYWNIGNEMYGHWQLGHMEMGQYAVKHRLFADAMRAVDPSIYIVAPGGFVDEMTTGQGIVADSGSRLVEYGSARDWAGGMFERCRGTFDALATHAYQGENKRFDFTTGTVSDVEQSLPEWARSPADRVATMCDCWEEYKKRFPWLEEGTVKVFFDEWAYHFRPDYKGCLANARTLHEFFRHTDFIDMAGYTMATAWLDINRTSACLSASGLLFKLFNGRFGRIPVAVTGNSPVPAPAYPIGGDQPKVNTGSDTWPLDVSAALTLDRTALTISVVNATDKIQNLRLRISNAQTQGEGKVWKLCAPDHDAMNCAGKSPEVQVTEGDFDTRKDTIEIAAYGIEIYEYSNLII